jgi:uncharacterized membrane protein
MWKFVLAFMLAFALRFLTGLFVEGGWLREPSMGPLERTPISFVLPVAIAAITIYLANRLSPRRLLDQRVRRPVSQAMVGLGAGLAAVALSILAARVTNILAIKAALTGLFAAGTALVFFALLPRAKPYECVHCGTVLPEGASRCPGCGAENARGRVPNGRTSAA